MGRHGSAYLATFLLFLAPLGAQEWYTSSESGMPFTLLQREEAFPTGWILSIERNGDEETRRLYEDGVLHRTTILARRDGQLVSRKEFSDDGTLLSQVSYAYDEEGNPRATYIDVGDRLEVVSTQNQTVDGTAGRTSTGSDGDWVLTDYDKGGRSISRTVIADGNERSSTLWSRDENGVLQFQQKTEGERETLSFYDDSGRLIEERHIHTGLPRLVRRYTWDGDRLIRVREQGQGRELVREMEWEDERLVRESRRIDGRLESITLWESPDKSLETLYRDGKPVVRILREGGQRIREEFLRDGQVVRIRENG